MSTHDAPGGGQSPRRDNQAPYLIIGALLVAAGVWLLAGSPLVGWSWPWFEPMRAAIRIARQVAWPLAVIAGGVLLIVYSRKPGARLPSREARLTRSRESSVVAGVLGGLAEYFGMDPAVLRVGVALAALVLGIVGELLIAYIVAAVVIPRGPARPSAQGAPPPPSAGS